jgi:hypothetical protein
MAAKKFKEQGGVIVLPLKMINSLAFQNLSAKSVKLLMLMQVHWREDKAIDYGISQTTLSIKCSRSTASALLNELIELGFVAIVDEADFYANKARSWRLTYKPYLNREPTHDWKNWTPKN